MPRLIYRSDCANLFAALVQCIAIVVAVALTAGCGDKSGTPKDGNVSSAAADAAAPTKNKKASPAANAVVETPPNTNKSQRGTDGGDVPAPKGKIASKVTTAGNAPEKLTTSAARSQAANTAVPDDVVRKPATVEEARRVLDLTTFPLPPGANTRGEQGIAHVSYRIAGADVKSAFDFVRGEFSKRGWKEIGETYLADNGASGTFGGQGFVVSVSAYPDSSVKDVKALDVSITNHGNLNLARLPVPPGAKLEHSFATSVGYATELSPAAATEALRKLLTEQGWIPYGDNISSKNYKQNAILLSAHVTTMQAPDNRIMITYLAAQMSVDLPAPPQPLSIGFTGPKELSFESAVKHAALYEFYRETLAKEGWQPTTENPIKGEYKWSMIFRNPAKDRIDLDTHDGREGKIRGALRHLSAAEVAEIDRQIELDRPRREAELKRKLKEEADKNAQRQQEKRDKDAAEKEKRRLVVELPSDAKDVEFEPDGIKFTPKRGTAKAAADTIGKQFRDRGWKAEKVPSDPEAGTYRFERDDQSVTIVYLDTGLSPSEIRIYGSRVDFERAKNAKK